MTNLRVLTFPQLRGFSDRFFHLAFEEFNYLRVFHDEPIAKFSELTPDDRRRVFARADAMRKQNESHAAAMVSGGNA